jgi:hypothetical protein
MTSSPVGGNEGEPEGGEGQGRKEGGREEGREGKKVDTRLSEGRGWPRLE